VEHDAVDLSHLAADIPASLVARIDAAKVALKKGKLAIWRGPVSDNLSRVMIKPGEVANDAHVAGMHYLVQGVEGRLP
jgi:basic membrane protein A and related proteins